MNLEQECSACLGLTCSYTPTTKHMLPTGTISYRRAPHFLLPSQCLLLGQLGRPHSNVSRCGSGKHALSAGAKQFEEATPRPTIWLEMLIACEHYSRMAIPGVRLHTQFRLLRSRRVTVYDAIAVFKHRVNLAVNDIPDPAARYLCLHHLKACRRKWGPPEA